MAHARCSGKDERRARRKAKERRRRDARLPFDDRMGFDLGDELRAAFERLDPGAPWADVAPLVLPVIKRVAHPFPPSLAPVTITVPPGIPTGFGIDMGPAFGHVSAAMLASWDIDAATVFAQALDNLRELVSREPPRVDPVTIDGVSLVAVQGQGWGSALILVPDVLVGIIGSEPRLLITPVRNTLVALPEVVDPDLVADLWHVIASGQHDELDVDPVHWTGSDVVALGRGPRGLVH